MKASPPLVVALVLAVAALATGSAAQNTASGNYRVDAALTGSGPLLEGRADVFVLDADSDVVARRHAVPAVSELSPKERRIA